MNTVVTAVSTAMPPPPNPRTMQSDITLIYVKKKFADLLFFLLSFIIYWHYETTVNTK